MFPLKNLARKGLDILRYMLYPVMRSQVVSGSSVHLKIVGEAMVPSGIPFLIIDVIMKVGK